MKKMIFVFLLIAIMIGFNNCVSSPKLKRYYQIQLTESPSVKTSGTMGIIFVSKVDVEEIYNVYNVVYRESTYRLNYYPYDFWVKKPGKLIRDSIRNYLDRSGIFEDVVFSFAGREPDYILKAKVSKIEEIDLIDAWYAALTMDIKVSDYKTGKVILKHQFDTQEKMVRKAVEIMPMLISKILANGLDNMLKKWIETQRR